MNVSCEVNKLIKYYYVLLIGDHVTTSGEILTDSEEMATDYIETYYKGKFDQYVLSENPL